MYRGIVFSKVVSYIDEFLEISYLLHKYTIPQTLEDEL